MKDAGVVILDTSHPKRARRNAYKGMACGLQGRIKSILQAFHPDPGMLALSVRSRGLGGGDSRTYDGGVRAEVGHPGDGNSAATAVRHPRQCGQYLVPVHTRHRDEKMRLRELTCLSLPPTRTTCKETRRHRGWRTHSRSTACAELSRFPGGFLRSTHRHACESVARTQHDRVSCCGAGDWIEGGM